MDIATLVKKLQAQGTLAKRINDPRVQFGTDAVQLLGANLLPEKSVPDRYVEETGIRYRTTIANDGTFYSPVQIKRTGELVGTFSARLGNQDIGSALDGNDYDAINSFLGQKSEFQAVASIIEWQLRTLSLPLAHLEEKQRWEAIVDASVVRLGDNGFKQTVTYPNPTGHRVAAASDWTAADKDPMDDILGMVQFLADKGIIVTRIITSSNVMRTLARNKLMAQRSIGGLITATGQTILTTALKRADVNALFTAEGLPVPEVYDARYQTTTGGDRFMPNDVMVFVGTSGRDQTIDLGAPSEQLFLPNTLGYTALGAPQGFATPQKIIRTFLTERKPIHLEGEAWQTTLPVLTDPEQFSVIYDIDLV